MLVSMIESMKKAREEGYGIPALAVENEHSVRAGIEAAEALNSPVILISLFKVNPDICYFGRIATDLARRAAVPVSVCQDHGGSFEEAVWAIRAGFTDIMVDRSMKPFAENVREIKELVKIAHAVGVGVEAELGHVGIAGVDDEQGEDSFTKPEEALCFIEETKADALAVAIGTAHGVYQGEPKLQFKLLTELREKVPVPLVLHGGSGTGRENLKKACSLGICKLNISNDLKRSAIDSLTGEGMTGMGAYRMYSLLAEGYRNKAMEYIEICGSKNKA